MAIYRGSGSAATTTDQATIDAVAEDAAAAATSATNAAASETAAASSASSASSSATSAASSASSASSSASNASTSASDASNSASAASTSATSAASSATSAAASDTNAAAEAAAALSSKALALDAQTAAETAESNASDHADDAVKAAYGAEDVLQTLSDSSQIYSARHYQAKVGAEVSAAAASATAAAASETAAASSETAAAASATSASGSATTATTKASEASTSATNAATSATAASGSATAAASSATAAAASATAAAASETAAATSETNAAASESAASTSETNAAASATAAASSATDAASSATAAQAAEDAALAALDSFDDRYLGQKASAPTTDNDGDPLVAGSLYFNTTTSEMKVYDGSQWLNAYASLSGALIATSNLSDLNNVATARTNLGLGTAATTASTDYATAAQGATADSALQDITGESIEDLSDVATMTPTDGQLLTWDSTTSKWNAEDAPVSLPDQTGNSGKYLTTDGTDASWGTVDLSSKLDTTASFGGDVSGTYDAIVIADDSHNHIISNVDGLQTALDAKLEGNQTITLSGDATGSGTTAITVALSANSVGASEIVDNSVGAAELNVTGNGTTSQYLRSDGDGTFTWATPTDTNTTYSAGSGLSLSGTTFSHTDTSSQASVNNSGATVIQDVTLDTYGHVTGLASTTLTAATIGAQPAGTYNTIIGTDSDINTSGSTIIDNIYVTDGVITSMGTRTLTASDIGAISGSTSQLTDKWVNFNGTGTVAIRSQYGVSSITDQGTGKYRVNWNGAFANANYATVACCGKTDANDDQNGTTLSGNAGSGTLQASSYTYIRTGFGTGGLNDSNIVGVVAIG